MIDDVTALQQANQNRSQPIPLKGQVLEADGNVLRAKRENGIQANLLVSLDFQEQ